MAPGKNQPMWMLLALLLVWNFSLTIQVSEIWDWIFENPIPNHQAIAPSVTSLVDALKVVNASALRGQYLNFVIETLVHHQNNLPTIQELNSLIQVLTELQNKGAELKFTAEFISGLGGNGPGPDPSSGGFKLKA